MPIRSTHIWLLIGIAILIALILVIPFLPLVTCDVCWGVGRVSLEEASAILGFPLDSKPPQGLDFWSCERCDGKAKISLAARWRGTVDLYEGEPHGDFLKKVLSYRQGMSK